ncbi:hypothetical protein LQF63_06735 [Tetragenococcus koreensis]|uniref:hypothetical protein n=1 Tax=Tetragenococcus koreensis TaxID=290335 RepID=UPI001F388622|nr:hypothetical protein [Tetragenococcus koreensis]MCF1617340.1 hypothetical protein [Tetragenococcus koreensis]
MTALALVGCSQNETDSKQKASESTSQATQTTEEEAEGNQFGDFFSLEEPVTDEDNNEYEAPEEVEEYVGNYSAVDESEDFNENKEKHTELKINKNGTFNLFQYNVTSTIDEEEANGGIKQSFYVDKENKSHLEKFAIDDNYQDLTSGITKVEYGELSFIPIEQTHQKMDLNQDGEPTNLTKMSSSELKQSTEYDYTFDGEVFNDFGNETELAKDDNVNEFYQATVDYTNGAISGTDKDPTLVVEEGNEKIQEGVTEDNEHPEMQYAYSVEKDEENKTSIYAFDGDSFYRSIDSADESPIKWQKWSEVPTD